MHLKSSQSHGSRSIRRDPDTFFILSMIQMHIKGDMEANVLEHIHYARTDARSPLRGIALTGPREDIVLF